MTEEWKGRWRIYYDDGSTYSDQDGSPFHAIPTGVIVVAVERPNHPNGFGLNYEKEAFYWRPDIGWQACDKYGLADYEMLYRGPKVMLFGRSIRDETYFEILKRAKEEGLG